MKNDGVSAEPYGGNKVRKLELVLADAARRGARRLVTTGAGGSHHVLATAIYARAVGLPVVAVLCPQPWTEHAEATLRASLGAGIEVRVFGSMATVPLGGAAGPGLPKRGRPEATGGATSRRGPCGFPAGPGF